MGNDLFDSFMEVVATRRSCRKLKPDPLPEGAIEKLLEAAQWAMSGNNAQPWEFIVVTKPEIKKALYTDYLAVHKDFVFWMEQLRAPEFRHPNFQRPGTVEEQLAAEDRMWSWGEAPALIVVCGDGRKQWPTVNAAFTAGRHKTHLTDGLSNASQIMHLAARAMGLGSMWVTIHVEDGIKRILGVPDLVMVHSIIPVGYPYRKPGPGARQPLADKIHRETYEMSKHQNSRQFVEDLARRRAKAVEVFRGTSE